MKQVKAKISENKLIAQGFYKMRVESRHLAGHSKPGQFVEVRCSGGCDPLLRRPLGVHRILDTGVELLYEVVGRGTDLLSRKMKGEELDIIGPLGNGFEITASGRSAILVAGGIGVAPLVALAWDLIKRGRKTSVVIGARTKSHLLCERDFKALGCAVKTATDDGSRGKRGLATELLQEMLADSKGPRVVIYACGPRGMLKEVARISKEKELPCQVSLEERMACGVGVCLGCPVRMRRGGYKMVCKDGPVFNAEEIAW